MKNKTFYILFFSFSVLINTSLKGQSETNKLGAWLWYIDIVSEYETHEALAAHLSELGVKRVFAKVYDQNWQNGEFPELRDSTIPATYKNHGIECWAWAYNYPYQYQAQANALFVAAQHGYQGYILDIEIEFDGKTTELHEILQAHTNARDSAITAGYAADNFPMYCTTWGNPTDHGMRVDIIDQYVDAHMPQTYLEVWGSTYMNNAAYWVNYGTQEYRGLGATKPIHHIISSEGYANQITSEIINEAFLASGGESSFWSIPIDGMGSNNGYTAEQMWSIFDGVNWNMNFSGNSISKTSIDDTISIYVNNGSVHMVSNKNLNGQLIISDIKGSQIKTETIKGSLKEYRIQVAELCGFYIVTYTSQEFTKSVKIVF